LSQKDNTRPFDKGNFTAEKIPKNMRSYHIESFGTIQGIQVKDHPTPDPAQLNPSDVLIAIKAASISRRDIYILRQTYPLPGRQGVIPISDGAGEVVAVGNSVTRFKSGDRVMGNYFARWRDGRVGPDIMDQLGCTLDGMLTQLAILKEESLVHIPAYLDWEQASTLPCSGLTAWSALHGSRPISAGDTILTIGSGGVAVFAIQFARMAGAQVIVLTSNEAKSARLKAFGASHVINYRLDPEWHKQVHNITGGRGVDRVLETGGTDTMEQSAMATRFGGEIVLLTPSGTLNPGNPVGLNKTLSTLFVKDITLRPSFVGSRMGFEAMLRAVEQHRLIPLIDKTFTFDQALDAYEYLVKGEQLGKIVINNF
jgi:NADPH:quinone reductase-like Zn-dependent oxidoreductase